MAAALPFIPSIVQGVGSLFGGITGSQASGKAANQLVNAQKSVIDNTNGAVSTGQNQVATATTNANDILGRSASTQLGMYQPYVSAGTDSLNSIKQLAGAGGPLDQQFSFNPSNLQDDPGYAFTLQQGQDAIQRAAAAKGGLFSTGTLKSLAGYTTGTANQYFNDAFNRANTTFQTNRSTALSRISTLQGLAGLGFSGTQAGAGAVGNTSAAQAQNADAEGRDLAGLGMQGNQTIAGALTGTGNAQAAGTIAGANAWSSALSGIGGAANNAGITKLLMDRGVFGKPVGSSPSLSGGQTYNFPQPADTSSVGDWTKEAA